MGLSKYFCGKLDDLARSRGGVSTGDPDRRPDRYECGGPFGTVPLPSPMSSAHRKSLQRSLHLLTHRTETHYLAYGWIMVLAVNLSMS